jgi:hypothetical protein
VRVDNLDEVKTALRGMSASLIAPFQDKPQLGVMLGQIMAGLIEVDAEKTATSYLEELPQLAKSQATGMKQGEIRRSSDAVDNHLGGGAMKSNSAFGLTQASAPTSTPPRTTPPR